MPVPPVREFIDRSKSFLQRKKGQEESDSDSMPEKAPRLGIDLGTTHSCCCYIDKHGEPTIIRTRDGDRTMPSVVAYTKGRRIVGARAKTDIERSDANTVYDAKRLLGRCFSDPTVQQMLETWPFTVVPTENDLPKYQVMSGGVQQFYSPEEVSGQVLDEIREAAQQHFGKNKLVQDCIITVPAYFDDSQRQATAAAAKIAKLNVLHMINEPTAAALAFGLKAAPTRGKRTVLVFDVGGGTTDTVLLTHSKSKLEVTNVGGCTHLGGQDWDWELQRLVLQAWDKKHPDLVIENGLRAWRRLRLACENVKRELTTQHTAAIDLDDLIGDQACFETITRDDFEYATAPLVDRCMDIIEDLLKQAGRTPSQVDDVVVVGGGSRLPAIRERLQDLFPESVELHMTDDRINADEAVAIGAAVMATRKNPPQDNWRGPAGILKGKAAEPGQEVVDAMPHDLGIQYSALKLLHPLILKGTALPCEGRQQFTTLADNQSTILFQVFEGEQPHACDNHKLGEFALPNIAPGPAGSASISVVMRVLEDGRVETHAVDNYSGTERQLVITASNRASAAEVEVMVQDAELVRNGQVPAAAAGTPASRIKFAPGKWKPVKRSSKNIGY